MDLVWFINKLQIPSTLQCRGSWVRWLCEHTWPRQLPFNCNELKYVFFLGTAQNWPLPFHERCSQTNRKNSSERLKKCTLKYHPQPVGLQHCWWWGSFMPNLLLKEQEKSQLDTFRMTILCPRSGAKSVASLWTRSDPKPKGEEVAARQPVSTAESWCSKLTTRWVTKGFSFFKLNYDKKSKSCIRL